MPRRKPIPRYLLHKPSGQARVIIDRRHVYLGFYDSAESRQAYAKALTDHVQRITPPPAPADGKPIFDLLISELLVKYLEYATRYYTVDGKTSRELANIRYALVPPPEIALCRYVGQPVRPQITSPVFNSTSWAYRIYTANM